MMRNLVLTFIALVAPTVAFVSQSGLARQLVKVSMKTDAIKNIASLAPAFISAPVLASVDASSMNLSLEVTFAAYLAVLLGTFLPVTFLIVLYSQSEARKAGARGQK